MVDKTSSKTFEYLFPDQNICVSNFKISELTVTEIEEYKTPWILHDKKFIVGKDNFKLFKFTLKQQKNITCENEN